MWTGKEEGAGEGVGWSTTADPCREDGFEEEVLLAPVETTV